MRILYLSCHAVLEYDELRLFEEANLDYFSLGSYIDPQKQVDQIRPALSKVVNQELYHSAPMREAMPASFLDNFDIIIIMHKPEWIWDNWEVLKGRKVVWRTIGQSTPDLESKMQPYRNEGLKILRYSPTEARLNNYVGHDAIIRFYKDDNEFANWDGSGQEIITFNQNMKQRGEFCNWETFEKIASFFPTMRVYGTKNEDAGALNGGYLSYVDMREKMRHARVYFYTGTQPAAYTLNFIEAYMTGIPIVAIGSQLANSLNIAGDSYEVEEILQEGTGFVANDIDGLRHYIELLYNNSELAKEISEKAQRKARLLFGKEIIKKQWLDFLSSL